MRQFLFLLFSCFVTAQFPTFPNIGYLGSGYDLIFGNPHVTNPVQSPDPGYRDLVYNLSIYSGDTTPDQMYRIPMGTQVEICSACSYDFRVKSFTGTKTYQNSLSDVVTSDFGAWRARFSASGDFKSIENMTMTSNGAFIESVVECCVYKSKIQNFRPPPLSEGFRNAISKIPTGYDFTTSSFFERFFAAFGTHVTTSITMGGKLGQRSQFSSNSWSKMASSNLDTELSAKYSALLISAAASRMTQSERQQATSFSRFASEQKFFMIGGEIPQDESINSWIESSKRSPMPLSLQVTSLDTLLTSENFPEDYAISSKREALQSALGDYCNSLKQKGVVSSCEAPPDESPFPPPSIYGGQYQVENCQNRNVPNPYTGDLNCKAGYSPHNVARVEFQNNCYATQYLCLLDNQMRDPLMAYGGGFQTNDRGPVVSNPLSTYGEATCPLGYSAVFLSGVVWTDRYSSIYGCFNLTAPLDAITYAGGYQIPDSGAPNDVILNTHTKALSCPSGFMAYKVGRIMTPDHIFYVGADVYACLSNVFHFN